jgi:NTP pyrophosphatase (non-canonical NTP hydrolase)
LYAIGDKKWAGLSKLLEEAGEVIQVGGKLMGARGKINHWSGDLNDKLVEELGDLLAAIEFFVDKNMSVKDRGRILLQFDKKIRKFNKWHEAEDPLPSESK